MSTISTALKTIQDGIAGFLDSLEDEERKKFLNISCGGLISGTPYMGEDDNHCYSEQTDCTFSFLDLMYPCPSCKKHQICSAHKSTGCYQCLSKGRKSKVQADKTIDKRGHNHGTKEHAGNRDLKENERLDSALSAAMSSLALSSCSSASSSRAPSPAPSASTSPGDEDILDENAGSKTGTAMERKEESNKQGKQDETGTKQGEQGQKTEVEERETAEKDDVKALFQVENLDHYSNMDFDFAAGIGEQKDIGQVKKTSGEYAWVEIPQFLAKFKTYLENEGSDSVSLGLSEHKNVDIGK